MSLDLVGCVSGANARNKKPPAMRVGNKDMANKLNSLAHTKWLCKYHIVFTPKYRRKIIYYQYRKDLIEIIKLLCQYKGVKIIEGHMMPDHVHLLVSIPQSRVYQVLWDT